MRSARFPSIERKELTGSTQWNLALPWLGNLVDMKNWRSIRGQHTGKNLNILL